MATLAAVPASDSGAAIATEFSTCDICEDTHSSQSKEACTLQACEHSFHKACLAEVQTMAVSEGVCPVCSLDDPLVQACTPYLGVLQRVRAGLVKWASLPAEDQTHMDETRKILETAASGRNGDAPRAQYALALRYVKITIQGHGVEVDQRGAARHMGRAAEGGLAVAQLNFGFMAAKGEGVSRDDATAWRWIEAAANQGNPTAMYNAGLLCLQGRNAGDSVGGAATAATWWLRGAEQGHAGAQHRYASLAYDGAPGVPVSVPDALKWWRAAATQGHADALCSLGCLHQTGSACGTVAVDLGRAAALFEQAAQGGSADGAYHLAYFYAEGVGTEPDLEVATALLQLAAKQNHGPARAMLRQLQQQQPPAPANAVADEEDSELPNLDENAK